MAFSTPIRFVRPPPRRSYGGKLSLRQQWQVHFQLSTYPVKLSKSLTLAKTEKQESVNTPTQDDDVFQFLASAFARAHPSMHQGNACGDHFEGGITNGAQWYAVPGT